MKKFILIALLLLPSCEFLSARMDEDEQRYRNNMWTKIEKNIQCRLSKRLDICLCIEYYNGSDRSHLGIIQAPDHVCDGEETGAIP